MEPEEGMDLFDFGSMCGLFVLFNVLWLLIWAGSNKFYGQHAQLRNMVCLNLTLGIPLSPPPNLGASLEIYSHLIAKSVINLSWADAWCFKIHWCLMDLIINRWIVKTVATIFLFSTTRGGVRHHVYLFYLLQIFPTPSMFKRRDEPGWEGHWGAQH